ncbi:MAG: phosphate ABC transporter permease subunit PstC, partial [Clostridioides sp.]|nr:phosphate ABC transporter permease subunit PstC [Clostridioides sp.]
MQSKNNFLGNKNFISNYKRKRAVRLADKVSQYVFLANALVSVLCLLIIILFIFFKGLKPFFTNEYSIINFIFGTTWVPSANKYGVLPMIASSIFATFGAIVIGIPVGVLSAVYISELAPKKLEKFLTPLVEILAGIPSVLYGLFGIVMIVPTIMKVFYQTSDKSLLAVIIILAVMILPTIISISKTSIDAVPKIYKEGSLALGASHIETIFKVILPAAKSGILSAVILGIGRALGETMAIILVAGNSPI